MKELRTEELKPGMVVKLKSRAGTLPHNDWFTVEAIEELSRKQFAPLGAGFRRPFAARTLWLVQGGGQATEPTQAELIIHEQREFFDAMVRKGHARYVTRQHSAA